MTVIKRAKNLSKEIVGATVVLFMSLNTLALPPQNPNLEVRRKMLNDLLTEQWEYALSTSPEFASIIGDKRWNDRLSDASFEAVQKDLAKAHDFLARFEAIDASGFPEQEALNKTLMVRGLKEQLDNAPFKNWEMPVSQMGGIHIDFPQFVSYLQFTTIKDYDDFTERLRQLPHLFDQVTKNMRLGMADGLMQPRFLLEKVVAQTEGIAKQEPEKSPFAKPLANFPKEIPTAEQERIRRDSLAAIGDLVLPAYVKFAKFLREEYVPNGRTEPGVWSLPDGAARYAAAAKNSTTTELTPEQIHQIGLLEVVQVERQMLIIANKFGFKDLKTFNAAIEKNPALRPRSRGQILDIYRRYTDAMRKELPKLFGRLPKADVVVMPVEAFRENEVSGAQYNQGTPDGSRPGRIVVNTSNFEKLKTISMESTAYHEGVPGHHMQLSIQQELPTLPPFRQQGGYTVFIEGWALYSERLGKEIGFYQDPYSDYGRLQDEMLRAIRLVVDTGLHYKKWTREQVVQFFHDHSAIDEIEIQRETDRYIVWPGQALAYKIGQLKIIELRERARKELGARFDIREFHDEVLSAGALPLDLLETRINNWIKVTKATQATKATQRKQESVAIG
jgi:uncharacterized protein (DUF885 family)